MTKVNVRMAATTSEATPRRGANVMTVVQAETTREPRGRMVRWRTMESAALRLLAFSSAFVSTEPAPYDAVILLVAPLFLRRARLHVSALIPLGLLLFFNLGGTLSLLPYLHEPRSVFYVATSWYLAFTAVFFIVLASHDPQERIAAIRQGYVAAAVFVSIMGIMGYFDIGGTQDALTLYGRASATFKDPNVFGVFVILPAIWVMQSLLLGRGSTILNGLALAVISFGGIFLSFSRGAWFHFVASAVIVLVLSAMKARVRRLRTRIIVLGLAASVLLGIGIAVALSLDAVQTLVEQRANLEQSYDLGETGRFGNQARSVNELVGRPNGYGPLRFRFRFGEDPHNTYINAFASYGWVGGFSYFGLVFMTIYIGWRLVGARVPTQADAIAIWSVLFVELLQGIQIDTDHWRHWFLMVGLVWGLYAHAEQSLWAERCSQRGRNR